MTGCVWSDLAATIIVAVLSALAARYGIKVPEKPGDSGRATTVEKK